MFFKKGLEVVYWPFLLHEMKVKLILWKISSYDQRLSNQWGNENKKTLITFEP